jgi:hypothetical protein
MEASDPFRLLLIVGANIFGVYALYKIIQAGYWMLKDRTSEEEL